MMFSRTRYYVVCAASLVASVATAEVPAGTIDEPLSGTDSVCTLKADNQGRSEHYPSVLNWTVIDAADVPEKVINTMGLEQVLRTTWPKEDDAELWKSTFDSWKERTAQALEGGNDSVDFLFLKSNETDVDAYLVSIESRDMSGTGRKKMSCIAMGDLSDHPTEVSHAAVPGGVGAKFENSESFVPVRVKHFNENADITALTTVYFLNREQVREWIQEEEFYDLIKQTDVDLPAN